MLSQANISLFYAVNQFHPCEAYDQLMLLGTFLASRMLFPLYLLLFAATGFFCAQRQKDNPEKRNAIIRLWQNVVIVFIGAYLADTAFLGFAKHFFHHPRPFVALPQGSVRLIGTMMGEKDYYLSFPSGHASFAALVAVSLWPALGRSGKAFACLFIFWACWSRLALGVHFPVDVLAGAASAACIVIAVRIAVNHFRPAS